MSTTKKASLAQIREMKERGEVKSPENDAPEIEMPDGFWELAEKRMPVAKQPISMRVDRDIIAFFKAGGEGYQSKMHAVLRAYVDAKSRRVG